jgi:hypothetical protein
MEISTVAEQEVGHLSEINPLPGLRKTFEGFEWLGWQTRILRR